MNKEHRTKCVIKEYLRTDEIYEESIRIKINQIKNMRRSHSVKTNILQETRRKTNLLLSLKLSRRDNKT